MKELGSTAKEEEKKSILADRLTEALSNNENMIDFYLTLPYCEESS